MDKKKKEPLNIIREQRKHKRLTYMQLIMTGIIAGHSPYSTLCLISQFNIFFLNHIFKILAFICFVSVKWANFIHNLSAYSHKDMFLPLNKCSLLQNKIGFYYPFYTFWA